ncbi:MAG: hypothetical protein GX651_06615 [Methanomicrobiales archaeon]|nr:hypothetical protein [Methanomicrobiales archaeon]
MDTGKIMTGFSLILLMIAMIVSPSGAAVTTGSCEENCWIVPCSIEAESPGITGPGPMVLISREASHTFATNPYER